METKKLLLLASLSLAGFSPAVAQSTADGALAAVAAGAAPLDLALGVNSDVRLGDTGAKFAPTIFHEGWSTTSTGVRRDLKAPDAATGTAEAEFFDRTGEKLADSRVTLRPADGAAAYEATLTSTFDQRPECVALVLSMPAATFAGATWTRSDGASGVLAKDWDGKAMRLWDVAVSWVELAPPGRPAFRLAFPAPAQVLLQDNRKRISSFSLRIRPRQGGGCAFNAGETRAFACTVTTADGVTVSVDAPIVISAGPDWIPLDYRKNIVAGSALDFSGQGLQDAPAGKYGWLKNENGHFAFEERPGVKQRFYGVNLCGDACMPDKPLADEVVDRLVRLGYNAVRVHHYESTKNGIVKGSADGLTLNAEMVDRFDYFLAKCFEKGLYVTTDLFTSRPVSWRALGIDRDGSTHHDYKDLVLLHGPAFENWAAFARLLLAHVNPYTGRAYKDEPGLPLVSLVNEGGFHLRWRKLRKADYLKKAWAAWLAESRSRAPGFAVGADDPVTVKDGSPLQLAFHDSVERRFYAKATALLRGELGMKALFTNQNMGPHSDAMTPLRDALYDYVDDHFYVDHPEFLGKKWSQPSRCPNENPLRLANLAPVQRAYRRLATKPFTITEWNFSGPGMYRGVGGILTGGMAALQEWDGLWRFAYSQGLGGLRDGVGRPYYFDAAGDPFIQASDRACVCLFLRGDLGALADGVLNVVPPLSEADGTSLDGVAWRDAAWQVRTAAAVAALPGWQAVDFRAHRKDATAPVPLKPNPAIGIDRARGSFRIATPKTAGGFAPSGALRAGDVAFDVGKVPATVWASALDGRPIAQSRRILLTHLTDAQASGNVYAEPGRQTLLKWGKAPALVRNGRARVVLALDAPEGFAVYALETDGTRAERVPSEVRNGRLAFTADVNGAGGARMLYEIVKE